MGKGIIRISGTVAGGSPAAAAPVFAVLLTEVGPRTLKLSDQTTYTTLQAVIQEPVTPAGGLLLGTVLTLQLSSDNGVTWGEPQPLSRESESTAFPSLRALPDGTGPVVALQVVPKFCATGTVDTTTATYSVVPALPGAALLPTVIVTVVSTL